MGGDSTLRCYGECAPLRGYRYLAQCMKLPAHGSMGSFASAALLALAHSVSYYLIMGAVVLFQNRWTVQTEIGTLYFFLAVSLVFLYLFGVA